MIDAGMRVSCFTLETLTVGRAKVDASIAKVIARICRTELIVVDDIGPLPAGQDAAETFYRVVDAAHERRSVAVTSKLHPSGFDTIMSKGLATATVDRLLYHAHVILTDGGSLRLAEARRQRSDAPRLKHHREISCPPTRKTRCPLTPFNIAIDVGTPSSPSATTPLGGTGLRIPRI